MSLRVKMLATAAGPNGNHLSGQEYDLLDSFARDLVAGRYAEPIGWSLEAKVPQVPLVSEPPPADEVVKEAPVAQQHPQYAGVAEFAEPARPTITTGVLSGDEAAGLVGLLKAATEAPVAKPVAKPKPASKAKAASATKANGKGQSGKRSKKSKGGR